MACLQIIEHVDTAALSPAFPCSGLIYESKRSLQDCICATNRFCGARQEQLSEAWASCLASGSQAESMVRGRTAWMLSPLS